MAFEREKNAAVMRSISQFILRERKKRQQWCDHPPAFVHMQEDGMALEKET